MPWGRLDDKANSNAKLLALTDPAWRMWGCGLIYCQANLTDGYIPEHAIHTFGVRAKQKEPIVDELCRSLVPGKAELWHRVPGGYQVHDYLDWNDSRDKITADRDKADKRKKSFKERRAGGVLGQAVNTVRNAVRNAFQSATGTHPERTSTYHVPQELEKQERTQASLQEADNRRIRLLRRLRSKETLDGKPAVVVIAAVARSVMRDRPEQSDADWCAEVKDACASANLLYDSHAVATAVERARASLRRHA